MLDISNKGELLVSSANCADCVKYVNCANYICLHLRLSPLVRFGSMLFLSVDAALQVGHERIKPDPANFSDEYGLDIFDLDPILNGAA